MPASRQGEAYKFSKPFEGPFRVVQLCDNGADLKSTDKSKSKVIRVVLNKMQKYPKGICFSETRNMETVESNKGLKIVDNKECESSSWSGRLRSQCCREDTEPKEGECNI